MSMEILIKLVTSKKTSWTYLLLRSMLIISVFGNALFILFSRSTSSHVSTPARQLSVPPSQEPTSHKRKRTQSSCDEVDVALLTRLQKLQEQQDGEAAFGEHVAACLRQLSPRLRAIARIEIDKVLMHLQFPDDSYSEPCSSFSTFYGCS